MEMTDDNKELIFNSITRWLMESNFIISEEKRTIVTSEFYAKAYFQSVQEKFIEIISTSVQRNVSCYVLGYIYLNNNQRCMRPSSRTKNQRSDKINTATLRQSQSIVVKDKLALLQKIVSIDPSATYSKGVFMQDVSDLLEAAKRLEIHFNEHISNQSG